MFRSKTPLLLALLALAACATRATPEDAHMADALCAQGKSLLTETKYSEARDMYASASKRDENSPRAWNGLGASYDLLGKYVDALDAYQHAASLVPNDLTVKNNLAHVYVELGQPEKAVELLQPYGADENTPFAVKGNLAAAVRANQAKEDAASGVYAELGSYPTDGMAKGHIREAKQLLHDKALNFDIVPEAKTGGGVTSFTVKITGRNPQDICDALQAKAMTCLTHDKP